MVVRKGGGQRVSLGSIATVNLIRQQEEKEKKAFNVHEKQETTSSDKAIFTHNEDNSRVFCRHNREGFSIRARTEFRW